jgi:hypothetical protein
LSAYKLLFAEISLDYIIPIRYNINIPIWDKSEDFGTAAMARRKGTARSFAVCAGCRFSMLNLIGIFEKYS